MDYISQITRARQVDPPIIEDPVCHLIKPVNFLNCDVDNVTIEQIYKDIKFKPLGNREVAYFGSVPYKYTGKTHHPAEYPDSVVFKNMFTKIHVTNNNFTPENYTCVVTNLPDGKSHVPLHSDNEECIVPDSLIYCVSIGCERTLTLVPKSGSGAPQNHPLPSGSVYTMPTSKPHEVIPVEIQITEKIRPRNDRGLLSPYPTVVMEMKLHQNP